ncbi:hypothetical protein [Corynebacterium afermentans]|uniref:hypothetical protein n=1 Tax=Corynebacterium afermentans TaxID=38286 RepID=UPI0033130271
MESAKKAANELVESLPETANMGLMAYGANETDAPDNREQGCKDIDTLVPVGRVDKAKFTSAIKGLSRRATHQWAIPCARPQKSLATRGSAQSSWFRTALIPARRRRCARWPRSWPKTVLTWPFTQWGSRWTTRRARSCSASRRPATVSSSRPRM